MTSCRPEAAVLVSTSAKAGNVRDVLPLNVRTAAWIRWLPSWVINSSAPLVPR